jgi:hypothetical protein
VGIISGKYAEISLPYFRIALPYCARSDTYIIHLSLNLWESLFIQGVERGRDFSNPSQISPVISPFICKRSKNWMGGMTGGFRETSRERWIFWIPFK